MDVMESKQLGFVFALDESDEGVLREVKVIDRWFGQKPYQKAKPVQELTIKLRPFASYAEAYEIARYLNSRYISKLLPLAWLKPEIIYEVLEGRETPDTQLKNLLA